MTDLTKDLEKLVADALSQISATDDAKALQDLRVQYLGKKGSITAQLKSLGKLDPEDRPAAGEKINLAKQEVQTAIQAKVDLQAKQAMDAKLATETIDITCLLYTSPSPRDLSTSRMPSSA